MAAKAFASLWDYLPLKQGLRLQPLFQEAGHLCPLRLSSTKTRIKTGFCFSRCRAGFLLWDYLPLKQGLRHYFSDKADDGKDLWDYLPLKQGLRLLSFLRPHQYYRALWDYLPLKQGLRPCSEQRFRFTYALWDYLPLKQGLRLNPCYWIAVGRNSLRLSSTKTRIKTWRRKPHCLSVSCSETIFH